MKKLFSLVIVIFMTISLVACTEPSDTSRIDELEATLAEKETLITNLMLLLEDKEEAVESLQATIDLLQAEIEALRAELYDGIVVFTVLIHGTLVTESVYFKEEDGLTLFDLMYQTFDIDYQSSEFGNFITRINDLETKHGNYIAFYKNGEFSLVGVSDVRYSDQDVFHFELQWWDLTAQAVHEAIEGFLNNHVDAYLFDSLHFYVLPALYHLGIVSDFNQTIPDTMVEETANDYVKSIFIYQALGLDVTDLTLELYELKSVSHPYPTALQLMALSANQALDLEAFKTAFLADLESQDLEALDLDTLSLVLLALHFIEDTKPLQDTILDIIETNLYISLYGDNAASFAHVIMALVSVGIDPKGLSFEDEEGVSLIDNFLLYHTGTGSFYYQLDNLEADMHFSTPQAFLALVMYERYLNTFNTEQHPFLFE